VIHWYPKPTTTRKKALKARVVNLPVAPIHERAMYHWLLIHRRQKNLIF